MIFLLLSLISSQDYQLSNDHITYTWTVDDNKAFSTKEIVNRNTDEPLTITPAKGSEEFVIALPVESPGKYPNPLDKSTWTITSNSEHSTEGKEGPVTNLLDNDVNTIWHSFYSPGGPGAHDDRNESDPFRFTVNTNKLIKFHSISFTKRKGGGNGAFKEFQLYIGKTSEELEQNIKNGNPLLDDIFEENHDGKCYVNVSEEVEAQFIALLTYGDGTYASGAEFDLYDGPLPPTNYFIKSSDLKVQNVDQTDGKLVFTFQTYDYSESKWDIRETVELQTDKHYLHKYFEIKSSKPDVVIDYIDLVHFAISKDDYPYSWGSPFVENIFKNLGQPVYINTLFFGCRFPLTYSLIERKVGQVRYYTGKKFSDFPVNKDGYYQTWQTVVGVARSNILAVVRNDFFSYISDIAVASPFRKQYNSWYDWMLRIDEENIMQSFKEIERGCSQYGLPPFDSYVVDDGWNNYNSEKYGVYDVGTSGTTYNTEGFWTFNDKFPRKFTPPSEWTRKIASNFGVWLGPRGGYVTPGQFGKMIEDAGNGFYSAATNDVDVASHKYIKRVKDLLISFIRDYKVNYYKLDGFSGGPCQNATHDHMVGGAHDLYYYTDLYENYIAAYIEMIAAAKEEGLDNFWISSTTYTNLSPFHLQWSNSVWIQISSDMGETLVGGNDNECDQMLTYRDQCYWSFYDERLYQFPAKNLYNHDPIYGQAGTVLRGSMDDDYFRTFLMGCSMRGTAFYELYYTYDMIDEGDKWYVNSDVLSWAEKNFHILQHSQRFGGQPAKGEVYGYSAWEGSDGIVALRNPGGTQAKFSLKLDRDVGVTEGIPTVYRSTRLQHRSINKDELKNGVSYKYGDTLEVTLEQGEYRIYEFHSKIDEDSPIVEVIKTTNYNEILVRFNKYVDISDSTFEIEGVEIVETKVRGDLRTITITVNGMSNYSKYTLNYKNVKDIFGNHQDSKVEFQYFENNEIISIRGEFSGDDSSIMQTSVDTDSFTINLNIKDLSDFTKGVLLHSEDNSIVVEVDDEHHLKFTVGSVSVKSTSLIYEVGEQHYTLVRERNTMLKIYVNSEIDNSAYIKDVAGLVSLNKLILNKNSIRYSYVTIYNYGLAYSEIPFEISLKNKYIERVFSIENHKVHTKQIFNYRTDTIESFTPNKDSEEWTFAIPITNDKNDEYKPIDRSEWSVTANSEQTTKPGAEGAAVNIIDGNVNTLWHSKYNDKGQGGHDDRKSESDPFQITFNFNKQISFKAFSHTPRQNGPNGIIKHYQIYVGNSTEELQSNIDNKKFVSDGKFEYFHTYPVYVNFKEQITAQYLAFLSLEHNNLGSGADFSLYEDFVTDPHLLVKSSDCDVEWELRRNSEDVQTLVFKYHYLFFETGFNITETYELLPDKSYIEKQIEIQCNSTKQKIYFIDLESISLNERDESESWTHPIREQDVDSGLTPFVINLGQPIYIKSFFTGCRFPLNDNAIEDHVAHLRYHTGKTFGQLLEDNPIDDDQDEDTYYCWKTVLGAARSDRLEVVRNDLFSYISEISVPTTFRKQYNSWYDWMLKIDESNILTSFKEIERGCSQYGIPPLDSYVVDDGWNNYNTKKYGVYDEGTSGTTYNEAGFWVFNTKFPEGLKNPSNFAHSISSRFGVWLGPRGGYVTPGQFGKVIEDAGNGYYNAQAGDIDVGSHKYIKKLDEFLSNWIREYKINYFKLDGFASWACTNSTHDHMVGGPNDAYYYTDLWERYIHVFEHFREVASENSIPNFWISITCYVNPSPFYLQWANSVWFQISGDVGYIDIGENHNLADQMLTYRDSCYYNFSDYLQFQFPAKNLYNHDPIYGKAGTSLKGSMDDDYFRAFLMGCSMRGNAFVELYYTYDMIDEGDKWFVNSDVLSWTEKNHNILQHSQRFGGEPRLGAVYGYSAWEGSDGIVALRNPGGTQAKFSLKLDRDVGVTEGIPTVYRSTRLQHRSINKDELKNGVSYKYGDTLEVTLEQGEYRIYEFHSKIDEDSPIVEVIKTTNYNEILVRFNKYVDISDSTFEIEGVEIVETKVRGDLRTVTIKTNGMSNYSKYTLNYKNVKDIFGNHQDSEVEFQYFENNEIVSIRGEFSGDDSIVMPTKVDTDSFTINLYAKDLSDFTKGVLVHSEDNSIVVEVDDEQHLKFTVGSHSVTSKAVVHEIKSQHYTFVRERNTMLKIYVNSEIDSTFYTKDVEQLVSLNKLILNKNSIVYSYVTIYNYGLAYSEIPFEISLKNKYIERVFSIENHKVHTKQIFNYRTDTIESFTPNKDSEEWTFALPLSANQRNDEFKPIDRSEWSVTANSEQTTNRGQEGAAVNMIDGSVNTIWHSKYNDKGEGGHDDRKDESDPFQVTFNFNKQISFKAFSYTPRQTGPNGIIKHYQIYVGNSLEELQSNIDNKKFVSDGKFEYFHTYPVYVNFKEQITAQYLALLSLEHDGFGSGADFSLYEDFVPDPYVVVKSSDCDVEWELRRNSEDVQTLVFTYHYSFYEVGFNITETYELLPDKSYIEKQIEIQCNSTKQRIHYIDLESISLNERDESESWTHPIREQDVDSGLTPFVINLGQPIYIKSFFTGCRFPLNDNAIEDHVAHLRYHTGKSFGQLLEDSVHKDDQDEDTYYCWKTVLGAARSDRLEVVRNDFFSFISEISVPTTFRKQYNSWYDWMLKINESNILDSFKEIERGCSQYGVPPLDSYVVDDGWNNYNTKKYGVYDEGTSGTTYNEAGFWVFNTKFPEGLKNPSNFAHSISSRFGVWLGPRGGYVTPGQFGKVIEDAGNGYYNAQAGDIDVGSHKYIKKLDEFLSNWIREYKINYFKLDGFASWACTNSTHDHMVGGPNDAYYYTDLWERYIHVFEHFREVASENSIPNFWISITCFVNPSPFYLQWANSVWFQISGDVGYIDIGENHNLADQMLTYRDSCYYNFSDYLQFQFPQKCLYNHDPIYGKAGTKLEGSMDDEYFRTYLYFCAMRGNAFTEMYYTYSMLDEGDKWYVNSEVLRWTEGRFDVLQHSQRFGGEPRLGEVYGYSAWNEKAGTIAIRNPSGEQKEYTIKLDRNIGVPEGIQTTYRKAILSHNTKEDLEDGKETNYGDEIKVQLEPGEARIIDFEEKKDEESPRIEVCKALSKSRILIRFNKRIVPNKDNYNIDSLEIKSVSLKGDLRSIILRTSEDMKNSTEYQIVMNDVSDQFGNKLNDKRNFTYSMHGLFVFKNSSIDASIGDTVLSTSSVTTDSFSLQLDIDEIKTSRKKNIDNVVLLESEGEYKTKLEIVDNKIKFSVGELTVTSSDEIPNKNVSIILVRERNKMIKIYVNGEISNSIYNADLATDIITLNGITLKQAPVVYNKVFSSNYGFKYNESADVSPDEDDDDDDGGKDKNDTKFIIIGTIVASLSFVAIVVILVVLIVKKKKGEHEQSQISFPLISDTPNKY